ncbi:hypothetical protein IU436_27505 [Nocardia farcinica]|uniref:hypothetical protein n=1 Tax=Nocardia TaxID=1817 RepID=UPI00189564AF|nr:MULTISPECIES: hypothetical protein [Nocardia]MBF6215641.1 hypothetical protein [Nocardia puris]MBF6422388.1 hypothetical protein [Nocardia farcinica]MBF6434089.1 hypothetical protein [Nocardia farcinica]MBF6505145.1 hypothetical protein [Nocardia farcinica]
MDLISLVADRAAWYALTRTEQVQRITTALDISCDAAAEERLSIVPPGRAHTSLKRSTAHREWGFPETPTAGDVHVSWDGSRWRYGDIPWWERINDDRPRA